MTPEDTMPTAQVAVLLEDINSKMDGVIDYMHGIKQELIHRMDEKFAQQDRRFDAIEGILAIHSSLMKEHSQRLDKIETKLVEHDSRFERIDKRFDILEGKFDRLAAQVDRHERVLHA